MNHTIIKTHVQTFRNNFYSVNDKTFFACKQGLYILTPAQATKILTDIERMQPNDKIEYIKKQLETFKKVEL